MLLSDRRRILLCLAALPLAGCGFEPALGTGSAARGLVGQVRVADATDNLSFALTGQLERRLGRGDGGRFTLTYAIRTKRDGLGITPGQVTTRFNLSGDVDYVLTDATTGAAVAQGTVTNFVGYSATSTTVANLRAESDAKERLMVILADQLVTELIAKVDA
ncbi:hypothetical protein ACMU_02860 [Actibacterium mucosum KCTC 23349]|uniref:Lipoprotein n=1 Tax=Actibacterium mucosum KCTC 23349 TaxID=1454373 RepID=A0A037ZRJ5_9RHOB|nr:LPS assembly lipoprotein LptE [Actibacterium mucosum]KAJ57462.1 hypothetical protein ACMU_02860 [Actibacterium mucosum KCTC 23349]